MCDSVPLCFLKGSLLSSLESLRGLADDLLGLGVKVAKIGSHGGLKCDDVLVDNVVVALEGWDPFVAALLLGRVLVLVGVKSCIVVVVVSCAATQKTKTKKAERGMKQA